MLREITYTLDYYSQKLNRFFLSSRKQHKLISRTTHGPERYVELFARVDRIS